MSSANLPNRKMCESCPFAFTELSEQAQNFGCLPAPIDIINKYENNEGHWGCHSHERKCGGFTRYRARRGEPFDKNNETLWDLDNAQGDRHQKLWEDHIRENNLKNPMPIVIRQSLDKANP